MKKLIVVMIMALLSGCTSFAGIAQTGKPGEYYVLTNTRFLIAIIPSANLCKTSADGDINCTEVRYKSRWAPLIK